MQKIFKKYLAIAMIASLLLTAFSPVAFAQSTGSSAPSPAATTGSSNTTNDTNANGWDNNDIDNARNNLDNSQRDLQNRKGEQKNNFNQTDTDLTGLNTLMVSWGEVINQMENELSNGTSEGFWNLQRDEQDIREDVDRAFQDAYGQKNLKETIKNATKEKPKQLKDMERQLKDIKRNAEKADMQIATTTLDAHMKKAQDLIAAMAALAQKAVSADYTSQDKGDDLNDLIRSFEDTSQDFYDAWNDLNETVNNAERLSNVKRNEKDRERSIKDIERNLKQFTQDKVSPENLTELKTAIEKLKEISGKISAAITQGNVDDADALQQDFWNQNKDTWDISNEVNEIANQGQQKKDTERRYKEMNNQYEKEIQGECKRNGCEGRIDIIRTKLGELVKKMEEAIKASEYDSFWDYERDFNDFMRDFWDNMQGKNQERDLRRWLKDLAREYTELDKWSADVIREAGREGASFTVEEAQAVRSILDNKIEPSLKKAKTHYDNAEFDLAFEELQFNFEDYRRQFHDAMDGLHKKREVNDFKAELKRIEEDLTNAEVEINAELASNKIGATKAKLCLGYVDKGWNFLSQLRDVISQNKVGEVEEIRVRFESLGNRAERDCGDLLHAHKRDTGQFASQYIDEALEARFKEIIEKVSGDMINKVINKLIESNTAILNGILERVGEKFQKEIAKAFETASFIPQQQLEGILSMKSVVLERVGEIDDRIRELKEQKKLAQAEIDDLSEIREGIALYNFYGDAGSEMEEELANFNNEVGGLSKDEIKARIKSLKEKKKELIAKAKQDKFKNNVIPFIDTDDDQWFTANVAELKNKNVVSGKKNEQGEVIGYDPGALVTIAEILRMAFEANGIAEAEGESRFAGHWANGYFKQVEDRGLSLADDENLNIDRPATRAEVVKLALEIKGIVPSDVSSSSFSDVLSSHPHINYIEEAKALGIVSGDSDTGTFRADEGINRAEAAKIINLARVIE